MTKGKSTKLQSSHVRFGKRTYFFDVNQAENKKKYLKITESKFMGEGEKRVYNSFILFPDGIAEFSKHVADAANFLG